MTYNYQKKGENPIRDLACAIVSAKYYYPVFSSKVEQRIRGEIKTFPCVMIEPVRMMVDLHGESLAKREFNRIARRVKDAKLSILNDFPSMHHRMEAMFKETTAINELIGAIKAEIMTIDERTARKARKS